MIIRQIRSSDGTGTLSYIIGDKATRMGAIIDPNIEDIDQIRNLVDELGLTITHIVDTHTHVDHISGAGRLRDIYKARVVMHRNTTAKPAAAAAGVGDRFGIGDILRANAETPVDMLVADGDLVEIGALKMQVLHTPGHTDNHIALKVEDALFTGDLLLIGQAGRSDLPGGDPGDQYDSLRNKVLPLSDGTRIYPGHDYDANVFALLGGERVTNPFLKSRTREEYIAFVREFFPPIAESIGKGNVTVQCGTKRVSHAAEPFVNITPRDLATMLRAQPAPFLIDVREPFELIAFGAVPGVHNIPAAQVQQRMNELPDDRSAPIVVICQSGGRSYEIAHFLGTHGYTNVHNLQGGTLGWTRSGGKTERGAMTTV